MQPQPFKLPTLDTAALYLADWLTNLSGNPGDDARFVRLSHGDAIVCLCATNCLDAAEPADNTVPGYAALREEADRLEYTLNSRAKVLFYLARPGRKQSEDLEVCKHLVRLLRNTTQYASLMVANQDNTMIVQRSALR
jgi:hypothetical protein